MSADKPKAGLEDTVATSSAICYLDGDRGVLAYCGHDIHELARHATFEEVCYLLWHVEMVSGKTLNAVLFERVAPRLGMGGTLVVLALVAGVLSLIAWTTRSGASASTWWVVLGVINTLQCRSGPAHTLGGGKP